MKFAWTRNEDEEEQFSTLWQNLIIVYENGYFYIERNKMQTKYAIIMCFDMLVDDDYYYYYNRVLF